MMPNEMNVNNFSFESAQQIVELQQPHLSSQPADLSSNSVLQQQQHVRDEVTIEMKEMIQDCKDGLLSKHCCIFRVPIILHHHKEEAYTPKLVSIGPFHYSDKRLQDMENHKQILFKKFTERAKSSLDDLVRCVTDLEPKLRASYADTINLTKQELVKLALMDAAFIIEFFIMFHWELKDDVKLSQPWLANSICLDLILLENQLPFFVIEELFNKAFPQGYRGSIASFLSLACIVLEHNEKKLEPGPEVQIMHFTDLIRSSYLQSYLQGKNIERPQFLEVKDQTLRYNANALQEAGIKLISNKGNCLLDLKFSGHALEIPKVVVDDVTELLFRNIIALEQCCYPHDAYFTDYALVWDWLIDTHKDVDILIHNKIVNKSLGDSNNGASLFNDLLKNVHPIRFNSDYLDICKRLNKYYEDSCHKKKATLRRDYCNTPWRTVASIAGIILLILTIVQTIFSILQVVLQRDRSI